MRIHFYGKLADSFGRICDLNLDNSCSLAELKTLLSRTIPGAAELLQPGKVRACVDDVLVPDSALVQPAQTIEFFPPVSGG